MRRALRTLVAGIGAFAGLLWLEAKLARRVERLEGFTRDELDGIVGDGSDEPVPIAWVGDSTSVGVGATAAELALPRLVGRALARPVHLTVLAESGARVVDALARQVPELATLRPRWVFVALGANDVIHLTPRPLFRAQLVRLLASINALRPERVVVLGLGEFGSSVLLRQPLRALAGRRGHQLDGDLRAAARRYGATYVDIVALAGDRFYADPRRYHARDGFHPSDDGYGLWADATLETLARAGVAVARAVPATHGAIRDLSP